MNKNTIIIILIEIEAVFKIQTKSIPSSAMEKIRHQLR